DWRAFRARLVERAARGAPAAAAPAARGWIHETPLIERGSVLLAKPGEHHVLGERTHFHKAVVLLLGGDGRGGHSGIILNRPTSGAAVLGDADLAVWYGGPSQGIGQPGTEKYISGKRQPESPEPEPYVFSNIACLHARPELATPGAQSPAGRAAPAEFVLCVGRCEWPPGQLELGEGSVAWTLAAASAEALLASLPRRRALERWGRGGGAGPGRAAASGVSAWRLAGL
ncbi:unnamed protein product, partial [Prorocentrum cordatum]